MRQFENKYKTSPASLGLSVDTIEVDGKPEKGVLLLQSDGIQVRSLHSVSTSLREMLFNGSQQVRGDQGAEVFKAWKADSASRPKALGKGDLSSLTVENVAKKAEELLTKAAEEAARLAQISANLPEAPAEPEMPPPPMEEDEDEEEVVPSTGISMPIVLPSAQAKSAAKRKKNPEGEARKRLKGKCSAHVTTVAKSEVNSAAASSCGRNAGASGVSIAPSMLSGHSAAAPSDTSTSAQTSPSTSKLTKLSPQEKAKYWMDVIQLEKVLAGKGQKAGKDQKEQTSHGREIWGAECTLAALENNKNTQGCVEQVLLQAHLDLARNAEEPQRERAQENLLAPPKQP